MAKIKNNHVGYLSVGKTRVPEGGTVLIDNWDIYKEAEPFKSWVKAGILSVVEPEKIKKVAKKAEVKPAEEKKETK